MPVLVMMGPSEFKMLSEEPRGRVVQGTMDDYERALAEGLITPYQGRPLRFDQPAPAQSAQTAAAPAQPQAEWRGRPVPTPPAQTYSAPAPVAYQPAPSRGSVGMQIVSAGQPVVREPARMQGAARPPAFNTQSLPPMSYDNTILTNPAQEQMQAWRPAPYGAYAPNTEGTPPLFYTPANVNPVTGLPYQREDLPQPDASDNSMALAQPMPAYPFMSLPQTMPEPLVQQWNAQNIPGLAEMTAPVAAAPDAMTRMYPQNSMQFTGGPEETGAMRRVMPVLEQPSNLYEAWRNPQPAGAYSSMTQVQPMPQPMPQYGAPIVIPLEIPPYVAPSNVTPTVDEFGNVIVDPYSNRWR